MPPPMPVHFHAGTEGLWHVGEIRAVTGEGLDGAARLEVDRSGGLRRDAAWTLTGTTSNERYVERAERTALGAVQPDLGRPDATHAALIPIRKSETWWELTQDERRAILEERSRHIETGLRFLPAIARRLHHCRDLGGPFDFLTWFEFAPAADDAFDELLGALRSTEEWQYVDREVEIRLTLAAP